MHAEADFVAAGDERRRLRTFAGNGGLVGPDGSFLLFFQEKVNAGESLCFCSLTQLPTGSDNTFFRSERVPVLAKYNNNDELS